VGDIRKCIVELIEVTAIDRNGEDVCRNHEPRASSSPATFTQNIFSELARRIERSRLQEKQRDVATVMKSGDTEWR